MQIELYQDSSHRPRLDARGGVGTKPGVIGVLVRLKVAHSRAGGICDCHFMPWGKGQ